MATPFSVLKVDVGAMLNELSVPALAGALPR